jgi:hypothetical protein
MEKKLKIRQGVESKEWKARQGVQNKKFERREFKSRG